MIKHFDSRHHFVVMLLVSPPSLERLWRDKRNLFVWHDDFLFFSSKNQVSHTLSDIYHSTLDLISEEIDREITGVTEWKMATSRVTFLLALSSSQTFFLTVSSSSSSSGLQSWHRGMGNTRIHSCEKQPSCWVRRTVREKINRHPRVPSSFCSLFSLSLDSWQSQGKRKTVSRSESRDDHFSFFFCLFSLVLSVLIRFSHRLLSSPLYLPLFLLSLFSLLYPRLFLVSFVERHGEDAALSHSVYHMDLLQSKDTARLKD